MLALIYHNLQENPDNVRTTGIILGLFLLLGHSAALLQPNKAHQIVKAFPRHQMAGNILLAVAAFWSWSLLKGIEIGPLQIPQMTLSEFTWIRRPLIFLIPILYFVILVYADQFLAVRALGCLMFLAASLLLDIVWMHFDIHFTRQLIPLYCYLVLIIPALVFVGQPWRVRDLITWLGEHPKTWRSALAGGAAFGAILLTSALVLW